MPIPTDFYKRYYFEQNILQPRRYNYLPFLKMNINLFFNQRRRGSNNSDGQGKDQSTKQTFHSKYSGKGKKYADLNGNISIKCLNKLCLDLDIIKIPYFFIFALMYTVHEKHQLI